MVSLLVLLALGFLAFTCQNMCWNPHAGRLSPLCPNTSTYAPETSGNHLVPVLQVFSPFLNTQASNNIFKIILGCTQKEHTQKAGWLALIDSLIKHPESPSFGPSLVLGQGFPGIPRWHDGKESACQCRTCKRLGLDPWVRKSPWRRKWRPTPVFSPGKSHSQEPGGLQSTGSQRVRHDWMSTHTRCYTGSMSQGKWSPQAPRGQRRAKTWKRSRS